jgi:glycosyltransferase involved in cell wall biosynthesis
MHITHKKPFVIALVQLPPPMHGAAAMNQHVVESKLLNETFDIETIPVQLSNSMADLGIISARKMLRVTLLCLRLTRALLRRPDMIYFTLSPHGGGFYAGLPLVALAKFSGTRLTLHFHGKGIADEARRSPLYRRLMKWALSGSRLILLSPRLLEDAGSLADHAAVTFIPNGIEPTAMATPSRDLREKTTPQILFLSNLERTKGPLVLLDALTILVKREIPFEAVFAGQGTASMSAERFGEEIRERHLEDRVRYIGPVHGADKARILSEADIFAFPTYYRHEAFPVSLLEAMNASLAIVTTPEGAIPDFIRDGENGLLVNQQDSDALADALKRLIEDRTLRLTIGTRNHQTIIADYSLQRFEERMCSVWLDMLVL